MTEYRSRMRAAWTAVFLVAVLTPLVLAALADAVPTPHRYWAAVGIAFGFLAFPMVLVQWALVSRLAPLTRHFGNDALQHWHRGLGFAALVFVVGHALLLSGVSWDAWMPVTGSTFMQTGAAAFWAILLIVVTSVWRRRLRLSYEAWQVAHLALSCVLVAAATWHILAAHGYARAPALRWLVLAYVGVCAALLVRYRLVRPITLWRRPWVVERNHDIGGSVRLLRVRPDGHGGFRFRAGQFAWLITGSHPVLSAQHPLSVASSALATVDGAVEFAIKDLGDWSGQVVPTLAPGRRVWIDGPFGAFSPDATSRVGLVLIAGGIGIAPMRSMLLTLRDTATRRPVWLFYAASNMTRVVFRDELASLARDSQLHVHYIFEHPDADWTGERGRLTRDVLTRHLPDGRKEFEYFVCGPVPMMDDMERLLKEMGVPPAQVHTERFQMV